MLTIAIFVSLAFALLVLGTVNVRYNNNEYRDTAPSGGVKVGTIKNVEGQSWVFMGIQDAAENDPCAWRTDVVVEIEKTTKANTFSQGDIVGFTESTRKAELKDAGDFNIIGFAEKASTASDDTVFVRFASAGAGGAQSGFLESAQQALSGAGAVNVTSYYTAVTTTGANALTLADGTFPGQLKKIQMIVDAGNGTLTPTNLSGGTTITFADVGDFALLVWTGSTWVALELGNDADGATAPVLA